MNVLKIVIDKEVMEKYKSDYFKLNPRCRTFPKYFEKPIPMSWNAFIVKQRMEQNTIKQKYKSFAEWLARYYNLDGLNLEQLKITYDFYFDSNRSRDIDNYGLTNKLLLDGFVSAKVLPDDNSKYLSLQFNPFQLDRQNPRVEMTLEY